MFVLWRVLRFFCYRHITLELFWLHRTLFNLSRPLYGEQRWSLSKFGHHYFFCVMLSSKIISTKSIHKLYHIFVGEKYKPMNTQQYLQLTNFEWDAFKTAGQVCVITVSLVTKYVCNLSKDGDQICMQPWFKRGSNLPAIVIENFFSCQEVSWTMTHGASFIF